MQNLISTLRSRWGESAVRSDDTTRQAYGVDRTTLWAPNPSAVLFPISVAQVQEAVALANDRGCAIVPSGGRTGLSGGAVAQNQELVLSLDRLNRIRSFDPAERTVVVEAGVITQRLQEFAREQDLFYPVDFASSGSSQIGGNIATNAGGINVIRYGMTRDWVRGLTVVTGRGEILNCNHGLLKNNTGYDFRHLMIGSEGTLAIICEAVMALTQAPADPCVVVLGVRDFAALMPVLERFQSALTLNAFECFSEAGLAKLTSAHGLQRPFESITPYYALLEFGENPEALASAMACFETCVEQGWVIDGVISQSLSQAANLWKLREFLSETLARWKPYKNDISVPVGQLPAFMAEAEQLARTRYPDYEVIWYGHVGDGNLHLNILKPDALPMTDFAKRCAGVSEDIGKLVQSYGGSISAEHGVGLLKRDYLNYSRSAADVALMRGVKKVFDPHGVLNPGKIFTA